MKSESIKTVVKWLTWHAQNTVHVQLLEHYSNLLSMLSICHWLMSFKKWSLQYSVVSCWGMFRHILCSCIIQDFLLLVRLCHCNKLTIINFVVQLYWSEVSRAPFSVIRVWRTLCPAKSFLMAWMTAEDWVEVVQGHCNHAFDNDKVGTWYV